MQVANLYKINQQNKYNIKKVFKSCVFCQFEFILP